MTPDSSRSTEIQPDPRLEKRIRRRFSAAEKRHLVTAADALPHGDKGAWLRRNVSVWRNTSIAPVPEWP